MSEAIIVALIAAIGSIIGQALITNSARKKDITERARLDEKTSQRLNNIEKKLDEHNSYSDKINEIKIDIAEIKTDIKHLKRREHNERMA